MARQLANYWNLLGAFGCAILIQMSEQTKGPRAASVSHCLPATSLTVSLLTIELVELLRSGNGKKTFSEAKSRLPVASSCQLPANNYLPPRTWKAAKWTYVALVRCARSNRLPVVALETEAASETEATVVRRCLLPTGNCCATAAPCLRPLLSLRAANVGTRFFPRRHTLVRAARQLARAARRSWRTVPIGPTCRPFSGIGLRERRLSLDLGAQSGSAKPL